MRREREKKQSSEKKRKQRDLMERERRETEQHIQEISLCLMIKLLLRLPSGVESSRNTEQ